MRLFFVFALALTTATALPTTIFAQAEEGDARTHFRRGQTAYEQGDYERALVEWTTAYDLDPQPLLQFNIAQAAERLGRLEEAGAALDRYLETADPDDPNQANARARRVALRERISDTGILLRGGPEGASITIDGEEWGRTPRPDPISVSSGSHTIVLQREGYATFRSTVVVPAGQSVEVPVEMVRAASQDRVDPPPAAREDEGAGIGPWIVVGVGGAAVIAAGVLGGLALSKAGESVEGTPNADSAHGMAIGADISGAIGAAAISAGLIWFFVARAGDEEGVALTPVVSPQEAGMSARWSF